ncbi:hypothetical protein [Reinekea sp. G2M2-21]|uniref:hypothetical protein n=1 Tax=Reinekea sp. G2M2-21 TaxID=2788942 RepID=UPI0018AA392B|nr:hypothetical protein [Reinekea sp. G2M2-21]
MEKSKHGVIESAQSMLNALENIENIGFANFLKDFMHKGDLKAMGCIDAVVEKNFMDEFDVLVTALKKITLEDIQEYRRDGVYGIRLGEFSRLEFWYSKKECKFRFRGLMSNFLSSYVHYYLG